MVAKQKQLFSQLLMMLLMEEELAEKFLFRMDNYYIFLLKNVKGSISFVIAGDVNGKLNYLGKLV